MLIIFCSGVALSNRSPLVPRIEKCKIMQSLHHSVPGIPPHLMPPRPPCFTLHLFTFPPFLVSLIAQPKSFPLIVCVSASHPSFSVHNLMSSHRICDSDLHGNSPATGCVLAANRSDSCLHLSANGRGKRRGVFWRFLGPSR